MVVLYILGHGLMAAMIREVAATIPGVYVMDWESPARKIRPDAVVIHVGSDRLTREVLDWCDATGIPIIFASSGQEEFLKGTTARVVHAPNLAPAVVQFFEELSLFVRSGFRLVRIYESHQASKPKGDSGTAKKIASIGGLPQSAIYSIRKPIEQRRLGVPEEYLGGHAYHWVVLKDSVGRTRTLKIKMHGRREYAEGAIEIARKLIARGPANLKRRIYSVSEVLAM